MTDCKNFKPRYQDEDTARPPTVAPSVPAISERLAAKSAKYGGGDHTGLKPFYTIRKEFNFTKTKKEMFIIELATIGVVVLAAEQAGVSLSTVYNHKNPNSVMYDEDFEEAWAIAVEEYNGSVEKEIHERAIVGWEEPVFGGKDRDIVVGHVRKKSDGLLKTLAKRRMPKEYGDKVEIAQAAGTVGIGTEIADGVDLTKLSAKQRKALKEFLTSMDGVDRSDIIDAEIEDQT